MTAKHLIAGALALVALAATAGPAEAKPNKQKPKLPDLVVEDPTLMGQPFGFVDSFPKLTWKDTTRNDGKAPAKASLTQVTLKGVSEDFDGPARNVDKLGVGEKSRKTSTGPVLDAGIGAYAVQVCADAKEDVKEKNEKNNCRLLLNGPELVKYYLARKTWSGFLNGSNTIGGGSAQEYWESKDATLTFREFRASGDFVYGFSGTVTWRESGTDGGGCTWSGEGTRTFTHTQTELGELVLNVDTGIYEGSYGIDSLFFPIHAQCGESSGFDSMGPKTFYFLSSGPQALASPPAITGTYSNPPVSWNFELR